MGVANNVGKGTTKVMDRMNDIYKDTKAQFKTGHANYGKCIDLVDDNQRELMKIKRDLYSYELVLKKRTEIETVVKK
jgi:hypothetical protein